MSENTAAAEMPRYKSHKVVHALKIKEIINTPDGGAQITPAEEGYAAFQVDAPYVQRHDPRVDGYYVVYDDGYKSWSPAKAFEEGYTRVDKVDSTSDERVVNNVMRHEYRVLDEHEKVSMKIIKDEGLSFITQVELIAACGPRPDGRCMALAKTKIEEAVFWAVKGLTRD